MLLSPDNQHWLVAFRDKWGRAPRILHIGNIANNAYNNAKLLNEVGLDCDVICYDYYHIMGCPEWEDADFSGDYGDQFKPDWAAADIKNFVRPRWFAQGPVLDCIDYLVSRREGRGTEADKGWSRLAVMNGTHLPSSSNLRLKGPDNQQKLFALSVRTKNYRHKFFWAIRYVVESRSIISKISGSCDRGRISTFSQSEIVRLFFAWGLVGAALGLRIVGYPFRRSIPSGRISPFDARAAELIGAFKTEFPSRTDQLSKDDLAPYSQIVYHWMRLFKHYDFLIGYSTDPILTLLCDKPYFAFEHGTIREIPFEVSSQGRLTSLAYRLSQHIFVTNFDCVPNAEQLAPGRFTVINHPYDEDHGLAVSGSQSLRERLLHELDSEFLFFHPTRQDWVEGTGFADKQNDVFLSAFTSLRQQGIRVGLVACNWGGNVLQSRKLLAEQSCNNHVLWVEPLAIIPFERMCKACDVVVDQFKLGAFGGVVFKAMAVGTPIITYLNEASVLRQYPELPPVINCQTKSDIEAAVKQLLHEPGCLQEAGQRSRDWIKHHHGKVETVNRQVDQFRLRTRFPSLNSEKS